MIIAHTDDELLWGWKDLINEENWLVICVFQQYNYPNADIDRNRRLENFKKTGKLFGFKHIILDFIDNPYQLDVDFDIQLKIKSKLSVFINNTKNTKIVTHNPNGEYGHYHHKIVSKIVSELVSDKNNLYYFSFNPNKPEDFDEKYCESFNGYFSNCLNDVTVIGHRELSKISETIYCGDYKYDYELIKNKYPESFLNCNLLTYNKFLN